MVCAIIYLLQKQGQIQNQTFTKSLKQLRIWAKKRIFAESNNQLS